MYCEQERSGSFKKEIEEVAMTLPEFKDHFINCTKKYLIHHSNDIMSSQARRNAYEKMMTDDQMSTTLLLASDYSAILDCHSQDQLNQNTASHVAIIPNQWSASNKSILILDSAGYIEAKVRQSFLQAMQRQSHWRCAI